MVDIVNEINKKDGIDLDDEEKILISKSCIQKIKLGLKTIRLNEKNKNLKKEASQMLDMIEQELTDDSESLEEKILDKMKETKNSDPDMNANLYILYRNLVNDKISQEQALQLYTMYIKIEPYDKTVK